MTTYDDLAPKQKSNKKLLRSFDKWFTVALDTLWRAVILLVCAGIALLVVTGWMYATPTGGTIVVAVFVSLAALVLIMQMVPAAFKSYRKRAYWEAFSREEH